MATADLHFHSNHSDGKHSVAWVLKTLEASRSLGLKFAVLTDHDGIGGFEEFAEGVRPWWTPICASELSCTFYDEQSRRDRELHLLIYGLNPTDADLQAKFTRFREERKTRFFKMGELLKADGYKIDVESIAAKHGGVLGRPHIADALVEAGVFPNRLEAFDRLLRDGGRYYVKKWRFPLDEAIQYAKKNKCLTSIAHPGQYNFRDSQLKYFRDLGVNAIEVYHPRHPEADFRYYQAAALRLGFSQTGGSDFHTAELDRAGEDPSLGRIKYPFELAQEFLGDLL